MNMAHLSQLCTSLSLYVIMFVFTSLAGTCYAGVDGEDGTSTTGGAKGRVESGVIPGHGGDGADPGGYIDSGGFGGGNGGRSSGSAGGGGGGAVGASSDYAATDIIGNGDGGNGGNGGAVTAGGDAGGDGGSAGAGLCIRGSYQGGLVSAGKLSNKSFIGGDGGAGGASVAKGGAGGYGGAGGVIKGYAGEMVFENVTFKGGDGGNGGNGGTGDGWSGSAGVGAEIIMGNSQVVVSSVEIKNGSSFIGGNSGTGSDARTAGRGLLFSGDSNSVGCDLIISGGIFKGGNAIDGRISSAVDVKYCSGVELKGGSFAGNVVLGREADNLILNGDVSTANVWANYGSVEVALKSDSKVGSLKLYGGSIAGGFALASGAIDASSINIGSLVASGELKTSGSIKTTAGDLDAGTNNVTAGMDPNSRQDINVAGKLTAATVTANNIAAKSYTATNTILSGNYIANGGNGENTSLGATTLLGNSVVDNANTGTGTFALGAVSVQNGSAVEFKGGSMSLTSLSATTGTGITTFNINNKITSGAMNFSAASIEKVNIASTGKITGNIIIGDEDSLCFDLGIASANLVSPESDNRIDGSLTAKIAVDGVLTNIFAMNGVVGDEYQILSGTIVNGIENDVLSTNDATRTYTLKADKQTVVVSSAASNTSAEIIENGGSAQTANALNQIVANQGSMGAEDSAYVTELTKLTGEALTRGTQETIGQEATTATAQSALQGVQGSASAVENQMTSFRSGSVSAAMTSFSSGGATSALSDMADADTLADAYEVGFTSASDGGVCNQVQVWANAYGGFGEQGADKELLGYDFWNVGTIVGLDYAFSRELRVGALLGYSYNAATVAQDKGNSIDNALRFGGYSSYNWNNFFVDLSSTMGIHMIDATRNIWNGAHARGERTGVDFNINSTLGYTFNLPNEVQVTPTYSLGYTMFCDPSYSETGAGAANVDYESFTSNSLVQDISLKVGKLFRTSEKLAFLPEVWTGWEVEYLNTGGTRNTTNVGQDFQTTMSSMATHRARWGLGVTALVNENISVYGRYDHKIWGNGYNAGFTAGIKIIF